MDAVAKIRQGALKGALVDGVMCFKGIPYAAPPFGSRRFGAPVRPDVWDGVRDATAFGPTAPHGQFSAPVGDLFPEPIIAGDDCLNLNVWTPDVGSASLPVMVWIHGGSFTNGSSAVPTYGGHNFARDGVVCVTINYRLGADGFLLLDGAPANRGLLDQVAALEWVHENIGAFGGDPGNVTIFGESAGAMSVTSLLTVPSATGLFRRAIAQSGAGHQSHSLDLARRVTEEFALLLGVKPTVEAIDDVSVGELLSAQRRLGEQISADLDRASWGDVARNGMPFEPVVDGTVLTQRPIDGVRAGDGSDVDLLVGANLDEFGLFLVPSGVIDVVDDTMLATAAQESGVDDAGLAPYRDNAHGPGDVLSAMMTDWYFRIPAIRLAESHQGRTHAYEFSWRSPLFDGRLGACHALELGFVFDTLSVEGVGALFSGGPQALATEMHRAWVAFAATGDPGWPAYDSASRSVMSFGDESMVTEDPLAERRAVWNGIR